MLFTIKNMSVEVRAQGIMERAIGNGTVTPASYERMKRLVQHERLPTPADRIDTMVLLGTSPLTEKERFACRIKTAVALSRKHSDAGILISGKHSVARCTDEEREEDYSEAWMMRGELIIAGIDPDRITLEKEAKHTKENIENSFALIRSDIREPRNLLFVGSSFMGRRVDLYVSAFFRDANIPPGSYNTFIIDGDMEAERNGFHLPPEREREYILYEAERLSKYRRKRDL